MDNRQKRTLVQTGAALIATGLVLSACTSQADTVDKNISVEAEKFEVQRRIVGVNAITDTFAFEVEGRCSIEYDGPRLHVICKHGEDDYRRHTLGTADNVYWVSTQLDGIDVSEYHTKIVIKPEQVIPEFNLETSGNN